MQTHWYGFALAGWLAGCTAVTPPTESTSLPDHFNPGLDILVRDNGHPCGSELDLFDGQSHVSHRYTYDALGHRMRDDSVDGTGAPLQHIEYAWDNAGHQTKTRTAAFDQGSLSEGALLYDTLGRLTQGSTERSDLDPTDDHQVGRSRTTTTYSDFDDLGHPAHAVDLQEDLDAQTSETRTESFHYDELGRQTGQEIRTATGALYLTEEMVYDDVARTVSWQVQAPSAGGEAWTNLRATEQYDQAGHWLSRRLENVRSDGTVAMIQDTQLTWDGDRELSEVTTMYPPDHLFSLRISTTYLYECGGTAR